MAGLLVGAGGPGRADRRRARPRPSCRSASPAGSPTRAAATRSTRAPTSCSPGSSARSTPTATATPTTRPGSRSSRSSSRSPRSPTARSRARSTARCAWTRSSSPRPGTTARPARPSGASAARPERPPPSPSARPTPAAPSRRCGWSSGPVCACCSTGWFRSSAARRARADTRPRSVRAGHGPAFFQARALAVAGRAAVAPAGADPAVDRACGRRRRRGRRDPPRPARRARRDRRSTGGSAFRWSRSRRRPRVRCCTEPGAHGRDRRAAGERRGTDDRGAVLVVGARVRRRDQAGPARARASGSATAEPGRRRRRRLGLRDGERLERRGGGRRRRGGAARRGAARGRARRRSAALLVGGARPIDGAPPAAQGAGMLDVGRSAALRARRRSAAPHVRPRDASRAGAGTRCSGSATSPAGGSPSTSPPAGRRTPPVRLGDQAAPDRDRAGRRRAGSPSTCRRSRSPRARRRSGR